MKKHNKRMTHRFQISVSRLLQKIAAKSICDMWQRSHDTPVCVVKFPILEFMLGLALTRALRSKIETLVLIFRSCDASFVSMADICIEISLRPSKGHSIFDLTSCVNANQSRITDSSNQMAQATVSAQAFPVYLRFRPILEFPKKSQLGLAIPLTKIRNFIPIAEVVTSNLDSVY